MSSAALSGSRGEGISIRLATGDDAEAITAIYNHYVVNSAATFQYEIEAASDRQARILSSGASHPTIVACDSGGVVGFGALMPFRPREGWVPTVEDSVYVHPDRHRQGIGRLLLARLIECAGEHGFLSIVAVVTAEQQPSLSLHAAAGFVEAGRIVDAGVKFGERYDVVFLQRML